MGFVTAGGGNLYYDVAEPAPARAAGTILFHHGIAVDARVWDGWLPILAGRYRIVRFDMRGFGRSAEAAKGFAWSVPNLLSDLFAVADEAGADRFHLAGESMGGTLALAAALDRPERIASVTVSNGAHFGTSVRNVAHWKDDFAKDGPARWSAAMMKDRFYDDALPADRHAWFEANQASHPVESILAALNVLVGADLTARLGEIAQPVLLLHGDSSPFIPVSVMAEMHARLKRSEFQVFAHAKHGLPFSHGRECAEVLAKFLARQAIGSSP
jgi:pimeloyl-ACP methyl ester carboxylesterase